MNSNIYYLHIPKCGGHYIKAELFSHLISSLEPVGIENINSEYHHAWKPVKEDTYIVTSLRDPAKRTVSHFCYVLYDKFKSFEDYTLDIDGLLQWVDREQSFISNYQVKNLLFDDSSCQGNAYFFANNYEFRSLEIDRSLLDTRIERIQVLLRDSQLTRDRMELVTRRVLRDFNARYVAPPQNTIITMGYNINKDSSSMFSQLSTKQIDRLYELNNIDSEIYFNKELFFNKGE